MKKISLILVLVLVFAFVLGACQPKAPELGTEANPIQWVFVPSGELEKVSASAQGVADLLHKETGYYFKTFVATDYTAAIEAECSNPPKAQMGSLATFALITAADRECAYPALVAARRGSLTYTGQIIANVDSGIKTLADIKGKTFCGVEPTSTSGWIIPSIMLKAAGLTQDVDFKVTFAGSHDAVVAGVYNGDCDAGATFVDARANAEKTFADVMDKVIVVEISIPIPNDGVQFVKDMPAEMQTKIADALVKIFGTEEGKQAFKDAYQWDGLEKKDNTFYDPFRQLLDAAGIKAADIGN
ncbi:MAG: phosphate/phosphite/phosphonate ABC transporter substrate-binding protein [Anaerolineaceae bacterium]|jgi:phosphonate transport system substrate-binding protein